MITAPQSPTAPRPPARIRGPRALAVAGVVLLAVTACTTPPGGGPDEPGPDGTGTTPPEDAATAEPEQSALQVALGGPGPDLEEAAVEAVAGMSVEDQAGQVLVGQLGAAGTDPASLKDLHLGGVIVMGDAVPVAADGTHDVTALAGRLDDTREALSEGREHGGIISVDQEGGLVARVQEPLVEWPTPMSYGAAAAGQADATRLARDGHALMARDLAELGFTVDFAPSVDVTIGAEDPAIGARSFSGDPQVVADLGAAASAGLLGAGMLPAPKHFPGHGSVTDDSHVTAPVQDAAVADLDQRDWLPFRELVSGGQYTPMVMMGHVIVPELEPDVPSSVSAPAYEALRGLGASPDGTGARSEEGYDGVVVTDALNMGALVERYGANEAPVRALAAGADLLLMPSSVPGARDAIIEAVESGEVPRDRLEEAARRVVTMLMWRDRLGQELEAATPEELSAVGSPYGTEADGTGNDGTGDDGTGDDEARAEAAQASRAVSAAAVTVVEGTCGEALLGDSLQVTGGDARDRARLTEAARAAGLTVGSGPVVNLVGTARGAGRGDVVVALDAPFGLASSAVPDEGALIALYGRTPGAFEALVDVLTGTAEAPGALPVDVGEWPAGTGC
ncbi:glycoside hydrolase family 3 N-terminal domain-containing protein [Citricoccus sp.]|uniref:glycoside hydrolase family 3 N-terminal domain-containing protein n=1 Tax=Micrococcaceae TaxID=1268 RepID=UPI0017E2EAC8|nr:glycoside hydrolase family 3 N-terminal domain-containing protein [Citricoccus sp.]MBB5749524.1 beta-N-acetylhexosaminidase [Micrococcus sp. TA1]